MDSYQRRGYQILIFLIIPALAYLLWFNYQKEKVDFTEDIQLMGDDDLPQIILEPEPIIDSIIDEYFQGLSDRKKFNGTVLYAKNGEVYHRNAYGYKNFVKKTELAVDDAFQLASVSKTITAIATLMEVDAGRLSLSDTLGKFFPGFPEKNVTVHHLLCHRSGLAKYSYITDEYWTQRDSMFMRNDDVVKMLIDEKPMRNYPVDKHFHYNNTNFLLLASIIEQTSEMKFGDFLQEKIFDPLEMRNSFLVCDTANFRYPKLASGHNRFSKPVDFFYLDGVVGDKGICSTIDDLLKFDQALYTNELVSYDLLSEAFQSKDKVTTRKFTPYYGYGFRLQNLLGEHYIYHNGWWMGYRTYFYRRPADTSTVIILTNTTRGGYQNREEFLGFLPKIKPAS